MTGNFPVSHRFFELSINRNFSAYGEMKHNSTVQFWLSQGLAPATSIFLIKKTVLEGNISTEAICEFSLH